VRILDTFSTTEKWTPVTFTVIDTDKDVDIVVLASPTPLLTSPFPSVPTDSSHSTMGGDCEFLGYPFGGTWRVTYDGMTQWMPLTKHCTLSNLGVENTMRGMTKSLDNKTERVWILDGINNKGFSGGPVLLGTGPAQKIMAVVSGYIVEPADLIKSDVKKSATKTAQSKETVGVNSGFIIAYDISYAVDAIHKNPVGPLRTAAQGND
jgi:hypothetical protein